MFNANKKVTRHSVGVSGFSKYNQGSEGVAKVNFYKNHVQKTNDKAVIESNTRAAETTRFKEMQESSDLRRMNEVRKERVMESLYRSGKSSVYKEVMYRLFEQCLFIDKAVKESNGDNLKSLVEEYVDKNGGYPVLEKLSINNRFLTQIKEICESTSKQVAMRKSEEVKGQSENIKLEFELTTEESEKLDSDIAKLDSDTLEKLVKEKVIKVISEEKERSKRKEAFQQDIQNQVTEAVQESFRMKLHSKEVLETTTLFDGLMRESYKDVLESVSIRPMVNKNRVKEIGVDSDDVDLNIQEDETDPDGTDWVNDAEDFDAIHTNIEFGPKNGDSERVLAKNDIDGEVTQGDVDKKLEDQEYNNTSMTSTMESLNMDIVLVEAITKYTLLEMFYTMKLENYTPQDVKKMASSLIM